MRQRGLFGRRLLLRLINKLFGTGSIDLEQQEVLSYFTPSGNGRLGGRREGDVKVINDG